MKQVFSQTGCKSRAASLTTWKEEKAKLTFRSGECKTAEALDS